MPEPLPPPPPTDPSRILSPTTVANTAMEKRRADTQVTNPQREGDPGRGGWTPNQTQVLLATVGVAVLGGMAPVVANGVPGVVGISLSVLLGSIAAGLATFFGIRSAGPRKLE